MSPSAPATAAVNFVLVPDEPVEKFNPSEMGAPQRRHDEAGETRRGRKRKARDHARVLVRTEEEEEAIRNAPTPERQAKGDLYRSFATTEDAERFARGRAARGPVAYRAPPPIERMRDRDQLDPNPLINYAMSAAAEKLEALFYDSGLAGGIQAQDLSRVVVHGGGSSDRLPQSEKQVHCRQQFRLAIKLLGWHEAYPHRGAGRVVVDVVCHGMNVETAARRHMPPMRKETLLAAGMDRLREGLFALAAHWRMI